MPDSEEKFVDAMTSVKKIAVNIALPQTFDLKDGEDCVEEWNLFKMQLTNYMKITGLDRESEDIKISFFLTLISRKCLKEYSLMKIEDPSQLKNIVAAFDERIIPKRNVIYERYKFGLAKQESDESVDKFVSNLKSLAKSCDYNTMEEELIRDKIVLGVESNDLRKKLLSERDLTLQNAVDISRLFEATENRMRSITEKQESCTKDETVFISRGETSTKVRCFKCKRLGHVSKNCHLFNKKEKPETSKPGDGSSFLIASCNDQTSSNNATWYFDSGATSHISNNDACLENVVTLDEEKVFGVANGDQLKCGTKGDVKLVCPDKSTITAHDVSYVPGVMMNLLSVSQITQKGNTVVFSKTGCKVVHGKVRVKNKFVIASGVNENGLYRFDSLNSNVNVLNEVPDKSELWHRRLGHLNIQDLKSLERTGTGVQLTTKTIDNCDACAKGKQHRTPFTNNSTPTRADSPLALIHSDVCGPMQVTSSGGNRYFLTFTDDFSRMSHVYFIKNKHDVFEKFREYKALVENQTGKKIKVFRSDNGTEYVNSQFKDYFRESGIQFQTSAPYTPEQNGVAERLNRTLVEKARSMLSQAGLPACLWAEATSTALYLKNRSPTKALNGMTPFEVWSGKIPSLKHLRVFGCKVMVHIPKQKRSKWQSKAHERVFLGYCENTKTYRVCDMKTMNIDKSRDVVFYENVFPCLVNNNTSQFEPHHDIISPQVQQRYFTVPVPCPVEVGDDDRNDNNDEAVVLEPVGAPEVLNDTMASEPVGEPEVNDVPDGARPPRSTRNPNPRYVFNVDDRMSKPSDPVSYAEVLKRPDKDVWEKAMTDEIQCHERNKTWEVCTLPAGKKPVKSKWVFKTKLLSDGSIDKHKARLVAKGYSQKEGIDYDEIFAPVVRYNSIRLLLALAVEQNLEVDQMDVVAAFLHPKLEEEIYMELPDGSFGGKYCRLLKSIYGLKQASRVWNLELDSFLKELNFVQSKYDPCVYLRKQGNSCIYIAVYVDDLLIFSNDKSDKKKLKDNLMNRFQMKDLGKAHYILGYRIQYVDHQLTLDQTKYVEELLERFNMKDCNGVKTPMDPNQVFTPDMCCQSEAEKLDVPYQEAIGSLLYLSQGTRPDITYAVSFLSRFNHNYGQAHWNAVKRIFRYLQQTKHYKLTYKKSDRALYGYSDADWASDTCDRKSTTGYVFMLSSGPVCWSSKKQPTIALSSTEAEYMALTNAIQEGLWLKGLLSELHCTQDSVVIYGDNKGAIDLSKNAKYQARTKHIDVKHHFIRDHVQKGTIKILRVSTKEMVADVFTKGLPHEAHMFCVNSMMVPNMSSSGGVGK
ncbi:hypothetical protein M8J77_024816 [Diaphorina citri]|nr:hypothetical protein M8J77_024816 [Diaphorina citri]